MKVYGLPEGQGLDRRNDMARAAGEALLTSTHNLCFEHKYEKYQNFLSENFHFLVIKFSVYLNRHVFVMQSRHCHILRTCTRKGGFRI